MKDTTLKRFEPFTMHIITWLGDKTYRRDKHRLNAQINDLISLQSALSQSSQGMPKDYDRRKVLEKDCEKLKESIKIALDM